MTTAAARSLQGARRRRATGTAKAAPHAPARSSSRVLAYLIDVAVVLGVVGAGHLWRESTTLAVILAAEAVAVLIIANAVTGRSPGALVTSTATVRSGTDRAPGLRGAAIRGLLLVILSATGVGGLITLALGRQGQDWVDRAAGTAGVDLRAKAARAPRAGLVNLPETSSGTKIDDAGATPGARALAWQGPAARSPRPSSAGSPQVPSAASAHAAASAQPPSPPLPPTAPAPPPSGQRPSESLPSGQRPSEPLPSGQRPSELPLATSPPIPSQEGGLHVAVEPRPYVPAAVPAAQAPEPQPATSTAGRWIVLDSGQREPVDAVLIVGRAPVSTDPSDRLVTISDTTRSLSRTHLRISPSGRGVWVEDMFSANGTVVRRADGMTRPLPAGQRIELPAGTTLVIGERSITIR